MFQANLSYSVLQKYLTEMLSSSLINFNAEAQCYVLTGKGRTFLDAYEEYSKTNRYLKKKLTTVHTQRRVLERLCSSK